MGWMNRWDIDQAQDRYRDHPVLGPATQTLANLRDVTDRNSDGWPYWKKPSNAAKKLMDMITRDGTWKYRFGERDDVSVEELKAAYRPIKAFRTRTGLDFEIVEAS